MDNHNRMQVATSAGASSSAERGGGAAFAAGCSSLHVSQKMSFSASVGSTCGAVAADLDLLLDRCLDPTTPCMPVEREFARWLSFSRTSFTPGPHSCSSSLEGVSGSPAFPSAVAMQVVCGNISSCEHTSCISGRSGASSETHITPTFQHWNAKPTPSGSSGTSTSPACKRCATSVASKPANGTKSRATKCRILPHENTSADVLTSRTALSRCSTSGAIQAKDPPMGRAEPEMMRDKPKSTSFARAGMCPTCTMMLLGLMSPWTMAGRLRLRWRTAWQTSSITEYRSGIAATLSPGFMKVSSVTPWRSSMTRATSHMGESMIAP
mmetsp:Transcript_114234/g.319194  ORF Transcript_114234/g.319194 Transcript_114234/m.319194 type:complete len:324 (+) Transcript_114234:100-1071(+)